MRPPAYILKKCGADRDRFCAPKTYLAALILVAEIAPFWECFQGEHPELAKLVLNTAREVLARLRKGKYPDIPITPADWAGLLEWTPAALDIARRRHGKAD